MTHIWFCVIAAGLVVLLGVPLVAKQFHRAALRPATYSPSDTISVPYDFERGLRQAFPSGIVESPNCTTYRSSTTCSVYLEFHTRSWRQVSAGCSIQFYGGKLDSVFEVANCSTVGPPDGTITSAEREDLIDIRYRQLEIVLATTAPNLSAEARAELARRIIEAKGKRVREGEWEHSIDDGEYASHILGSDSRRDFKPVTAEHEGRFGAQ